MRAGVAAQEVDDVVLLEKLTHQLHTAAVHHPCDVLARGQAERNGGVKGKCGVFAKVVVGGGLTDLHGFVLYRAQDFEWRNDFAGGFDVDGEVATGQFFHAGGEFFSGAENRIHGFGEAGGQRPFYFFVAATGCGGDSFTRTGGQ